MEYDGSFRVEVRTFSFFLSKKEFSHFFFFSSSDAWAFPDDGDDELLAEAAQPYDQGYVDSRFFPFSCRDAWLCCRFGFQLSRPIVGRSSW